jgi:hypothetical protein
VWGLRLKKLAHSFAISVVFQQGMTWRVQKMRSFLLFTHTTSIFFILTLPVCFPLTQEIRVCGGAPQFSMSRDITTVQELWTEWHTGLHGKRSIQSLNHEYGSKWRMAPKERKFYSRRLTIIDAVTKRARCNNVAQDTIVKELDDIKGTRALNWLTKYLKEQRDDM